MRAERSRRPDDGITLVEVLVAMSVFTLVLVVFVDALRIMTGTMTRVAATTTSVTQSRAAADVLGRQLAYASAANLPYYDSGRSIWYFEFESDATKAGADSSCTQWRYQPSGLLQYRTWSVVTLVSTGWTTVTSTLANAPATQPPFTLLPSDTGFSVMRVNVDLRVRTSTGNVVQNQGQYTLRNSLDAPVPTSSTVCTQLGRP